MDNIIFEFEDQKYDLDMDNLKLDPGNLDKALSEQPAWFAWFASIAEKARLRRECLENELDLLKANMYNSIKKQTEVKMTEKAVEMHIVASAKYQNKIKEIEEIKKAEKLANVVRDAYRERKDCLITLSSNVRANKGMN